MSEQYPITGDVRNITSIQNKLLQLGGDDTYDNMYTFCTDSYEGTGGYITGDYLVPHVKEKNMSNRRMLSTYKNYIRGIVNSLLTPVFSSPALRATTNIITNQFIEDVDKKGNDIQKFTNNVIKFTKLHGVCFVVMDNVTDVPDTISDVLNARAYPYMYIVTADTIVDYELYDNKLISIIYKVSDDLYKKITESYVVSLEENDDGDYVEVGERIYHDLGVLPVISLYDTINDDVLPIPPTYDMCRINWQIFNQDSEQRVVERNSAFSMLTLDNGGEENDINLDIGSDSLLTYGSRDKTVNAPAWINPDQAILQNMMEISNNTVTKLLEIAANLGVHVSTESTTSAKHEAYKFIGSSYAISHVARLAEEFEQKVISLFSIWINESIDYAVKYPDEYIPSETEITNKITNYKSILELDLPQDIKLKLQKHISEDILNIYSISE